MKTDFIEMESDILAGFSDFIPRNQNQIADIIGNREKSTDRVHVSRCLKKLKPFLERHQNGLDELGKKWRLKHDIETIMQIVERYPKLLSNLQKNDEVLNMVLKKHVLLVNLNEFIYKKNLLSFKAKLIISPTFFKICLRNSPQTLISTVKALDFHNSRHNNEYIDSDEIYISMAINFSQNTETISRDVISRRNEPVIIEKSWNDRSLDTLFNACIIWDKLDHLNNNDENDISAQTQYVFKDMADQKLIIENIDDTLAEIHEILNPSSTYRIK